MAHQEVGGLVERAADGFQVARQQHRDLVAVGGRRVGDPTGERLPHARRVHEVCEGGDDHAVSVAVVAQHDPRLRLPRRGQALQLCPVHHEPLLGSHRCRGQGAQAGEVFAWPAIHRGNGRRGPGKS